MLWCIHSYGLGSQCIGIFTRAPSCAVLWCCCVQYLTQPAQQAIDGHATGIRPLAGIGVLAYALRLALSPYLLPGAVAERASCGAAMCIHIAACGGRLLITWGGASCKWRRQVARTAQTSVQRVVGCHVQAVPLMSLCKQFGPGAFVSRAGCHQDVLAAHMWQAEVWAVAYMCLSPPCAC